MHDPFEAKPRRNVGEPIYDPLVAFPQHSDEPAPEFPEPKQNWWLVAPVLILAFLFTAERSSQPPEPNGVVVDALFDQLSIDTFVAIESVNRSLLKDADSGVLGLSQDGFPNASDTILSKSNELCKLLWPLERAVHQEISLRQWRKSRTYLFRLYFTVKSGYHNYSDAWAAAVDEFDSTTRDVDEFDSVTLDDDPFAAEFSFFAKSPPVRVFVTDGALDGVEESRVWLDLGVHVRKEAQQCVSRNRREYFS